MGTYRNENIQSQKYEIVLSRVRNVRFGFVGMGHLPVTGRITLLTARQILILIFHVECIKRRPFEHFQRCNLLQSRCHDITSLQPRICDRCSVTQKVLKLPVCQRGKRLRLKTWETCSDATKFRGDLSLWNVSLVTDMGSMFSSTDFSIRTYLHGTRRKS